MPKAAGINLNGMKFEDAVKRMLATPPPPSSKKSKKVVTKRQVKAK